MHILFERRLRLLGFVSCIVPFVLKGKNNKIYVCDSADSLGLPGLVSSRRWLLMCVCCFFSVFFCVVVFVCVRVEECSRKQQQNGTVEFLAFCG